MSMVNSLADGRSRDACAPSSGMKERNLCVVYLSIPSERNKAEAKTKES